jgi:DNA-binding beta-propeller fold protein YncE
VKIVNTVACVMSFALISPAWGDESGSVSIFAGTGKSPGTTEPYQADSPSGDTIALGNPFGVEVIGNDVWITTVDDQCIWKGDLKTKSLRRIAGNGTKGYSGDGGPAVASQFNWPHEVRIDKQGNLFIADTRNHVIRTVDAKTRIVHTLAGSGKPGFAGDGLAGTQVSFDQPHSVVLDGVGGVLVADTKNHRIRRIDIASGMVTTIAGTGQAKLPTDGANAATSPLFGPRSLAVDESSIWIVLREGNSVWRINRQANTIHHIAGTGAKGYSGDGGPPLEANFNGPKGIAVDAEGNILVVDTENHAIRQINLNTDKIVTLLGGTRAKQTLPLKRPHGIAATDSGFLVGDSELHRVLQFSYDDE